VCALRELQLENKFKKTQKNAKTYKTTPILSFTELAIQYTNSFASHHKKLVAVENETHISSKIHQYIE
jgi:hypothetical protein